MSTFVAVCIGSLVGALAGLLVGALVLWYAVAKSWR